MELNADDLPTSLSTSAATTALTLMVVRSGSVPAQFTVDHLAQLGGRPAGNPTSAKTVSDIVSTRNGSGVSWTQLCAGSPIGSWELALTADADTINAIVGGDVQDLVLVIGYMASLPAWPS